VRKPDSLRAALTQAIPALATNPHQLKMWIDNGRVRSLGHAGPAAMEYRYKLSLLLLDFAADEPHTFFAAIAAWLSVEQPELLLRTLDQDAGIAFEIQVLDDAKVDILVTLNLDEAVRASGADPIATLPEPVLDGSQLLAPGAVLRP
jgi:hypothetical protein